MSDRFVFFREEGIHLSEELYSGIDRIREQAELLYLKIMKLNETGKKEMTGECTDEIDRLRIEEEKTLNSIIEELPDIRRVNA